MNDSASCTHKHTRTHAHTHIHRHIHSCTCTHVHILFVCVIVSKYSHLIFCLIVCLVILLSVSVFLTLTHSSQFSLYDFVSVCLRKHSLSCQQISISLQPSNICFTAFPSFYLLVPCSTSSLPAVCQLICLSIYHTASQPLCLSVCLPV